MSFAFVEIKEPHIRLEQLKQRQPVLCSVWWNMKSLSFMLPATAPI